MFRRLVCLLLLAICLPVCVGLAKETEFRAELAAQAQKLQEDTKSLPAEISAIPPASESASLVADLDLSGFLAYPFLITSEPALIQIHLEDLAHLDWQRFGLADVAPFVSSRSLPLQT